MSSLFTIEHTTQGWAVSWPRDKFSPIYTKDGFDRLLKFLFETCKLDIAKLMVEHLDSYAIIYVDSTSFYQKYQDYLADAVGRRHVVLGVMARTQEEANLIADELDKLLVWKILKS